MMTPSGGKPLEAVNVVGRADFEPRVVKVVLIEAIANLHKRLLQAMDEGIVFGYCRLIVPGSHRF